MLPREQIGKLGVIKQNKPLIKDRSSSALHALILTDRQTRRRPAKREKTLVINNYYWIQPVCPGGCCFTLASYSNQTIAKVVKYLLAVLATVHMLTEQPKVFSSCQDHPCIHFLFSILVVHNDLRLKLVYVSIA